jgi:hypothetical protein
MPVSGDMFRKKTAFGTGNRKNITVINESADLDETADVRKMPMIEQDSEELLL